MKPISLAFKCFGPYMDPQFIDFTELERSGLFLICGETGAGKTTILDAMCIALYGKASNDRRGGLADMRCKLAGKNDVTEVEFIFSSGKREYKFLRRTWQTGATMKDEHQCFKRIDGETDGEWQPMLANNRERSVTAKAVEIIGLNYDQFRQVMLLPQGQFEKLLTSNSDEKEKILTTLFHAERWGDAVKKMSERIKQRDEELWKRHLSISNTLNNLGVSTLDELQQKIVSTQETLIQLDRQLKQAEEERNGWQKQQQQAALEHRDFEELEQLENNYNELHQQEAEFAELEHRLLLAGKADELKPLFDACLREEMEYSKYKEYAQNAQSELEAAQAKLQNAQAARNEHLARRGDYEADRKRLVKLSGLREIYATLDQKQGQLERLRREADLRRGEAQSAERMLNDADAEWNKALARQAEARKAYQESQDAYMAGIGGVLAEKLVFGKPCPVCGSRVHPSPAKRPEGVRRVTDAELDRLSQSESLANKEEEKTRNERSEAEKRYKQASDALHEAESAYKEAQAEYDTSTAMKVEGIDTLVALEQAIQTCSLAVTAFEEAEARIQENQSAAEREESSASGKAQHAARMAGEVLERYKTAEEVWHEKLNVSPFDDELAYQQACMTADQCNHDKERCTAFRTNLDKALKEVNEKRSALAGRVDPDMEAIGMGLQGSENNFNYLTTQRAITDNALQNQRSSLKVLTEQQSAYNKDRSSFDEDKAFVDHLQGTRNISLQRYVLGVRFAEVTAAANSLLETVYGGRYRLRRTDEATGRTQKKGLELEVFDVQQNQSRSVNTLSGGEKFLVALSLAIGLSDVVGSGGGVHMEALFVDEGFGSLDDNAVDDAVEILHGIRRNRGNVVGVISHVARLAETIPAKLEVRKGENGSTICLR